MYPPIILWKRYFIITMLLWFEVTDVHSKAIKYFNCSPVWILSEDWHLHISFHQFWCHFLPCLLCNVIILIHGNGGYLLTYLLYQNLVSIIRPSFTLSHNKICGVIAPICILPQSDTYLFIRGSQTLSSFDYSFQHHQLLWINYLYPQLNIFVPSNHKIINDLTKQLSRFGENSIFILSKKI